jgi:hypothetical protein
MEPAPIIRGLAARGQNRRQEVAVMPRIEERTRLRARSRLLRLLMLGLCNAGCAAMTQDVDAYYRQMAINYQEALDKAKLDAVSLENQMKVLAVTGEPSKARKAERRLERIQSWEEHCATEKKRFEKAAEWMEAHFDLKKPGTGSQASPPGKEEAFAGSNATDSQEPSASTRGQNVKDSLVE